MHHPLRLAAPKWPTYRGQAQSAGTSSDGRTSVFVDPSLGAQGVQNARDLVADATRIAAANDAIFGTAGGSVEVIVYAIGGATDGSGGAIEVCASFGNSARVSALFEAELSECSMGGNLCGLSTGEALSRRSPRQWWRSATPVRSPNSTPR